MSGRQRSARPTAGDLSELLGELHSQGGTVHDDFEAALAEFRRSVQLPADAHVIGEPVVVQRVRYSGNVHRGLVATVRREDGGEHDVALCDAIFARGSAAEWVNGAYCMWLGVKPYLNAATPGREPARAHRAADGDIDLAKPVDLVVLSVKQSAGRCRLLDADRILTLRSGALWRVVPGEIVTVRPRKQWRHAVVVGSADGRQLSAISHQLGASRSSRLGRRSFGASAFFTRRVTNRMS